MTTPNDLDDDFMLADDDEALDLDAASPWKMLVVDDEVGIHEVTKLALNRFTFDNRPLEILSAYSAAEALTLLKETPDVAVILLDVVMESDHAGLDCARQIREVLGNDEVRIVLRTGQPGQAPEQDVILAYDINDYRAKTELSAERLFSTVVSALRSYATLCDLQKYREDAYEQLGQNNRNTQALIDLSPTPLLQIGTNLVIQKCNRACADLFSQDVNDLIGYHIQEVLQANLASDITSPDRSSLTVDGATYNINRSSGDNANFIAFIAERDA